MGQSVDQKFWEIHRVVAKIDRGFKMQNFPENGEIVLMRDSLHNIFLNEISKYFGANPAIPIWNSSPVGINFISLNFFYK